jgi:ribosomal protein S19
MVGLKLLIYNGKEFTEVTIVVEMIALRLGELAPTRKIATHTTMGAKKTVTRK